MENDPWGGSEDLWSRAALHLRERQVAVLINLKKWHKPAKQLGALAHAGCRMTFRSSSLISRIFMKLRPARQYRWLDSVGHSLVVISQGANAECAGWAGECIRRRIPFAIISHA